MISHHLTSTPGFCSLPLCRFPAELLCQTPGAWLQAALLRLPFSLPGCSCQNSRRHSRFCRQTPTCVVLPRYCQTHCCSRSRWERCRRMQCHRCRCHPHSCGDRCRRCRCLALSNGYIGRQTRRILITARPMPYQQVQPLGLQQVQAGSVPFCGLAAAEVLSMRAARGTGCESKQ